MNPVELKYSFIEMLTGSDLSKRRLPVMVAKSKKKGPVLWLTGCMHGDEIGGTVVIHEVFKKIRKYLKQGTVYALPLMNPSGFENMSRTIAITREDLNRSFPGDKKGSLAQRIAHKIFEAIVKTKPTLVVDLHNDWNKSIPYVLIDNGIKTTNSNVCDFASACGLLQVWDKDVLASSLTFNLIQKGIPALTLELGESWIINEKNINSGVDVILNLLKKMNMITSGNMHPLSATPSMFKHKKVHYFSLPLSSASGIIRFNKKPGETVKKGERIARIYNAFGKTVETLTALEDGLVLGHVDYAIAYPGAQVMAFGIG
ncbi:MAG: succinylglutamate desuccinylase/aspartoacylase family protein [Fibrobacteria bacterium]|nr:succinylglutamate desuccinylase/aspartoacylase family protein [Fibrobacteria bacterium]